MRTRPVIEYIHEGLLVAEVVVTLIETDSEWSPGYSIEDVRKIESAREALKCGDLSRAAKLGRVYEMTPLAAD